MRRQVEPDRRVFPLQLLLAGPAIHVGQLQRLFRIAPAEELVLTKRSVFLRTLGKPHDPVQAFDHSGAIGLQLIEGSGGHEIFQGSLVQLAGGNPPGKVPEAPERLISAHRDNVLDRLLTHALDGPHCINNLAILHVEVNHRPIDRGRHDLDPHAPGFLAEIAKLLRVPQIKGHGRRHELHRVVRLQPGRMIGDKRVGRRVRLVEAVVGELRDKIEDRSGLPLVDAALDRTINEPGPLDFHLRGNLLAHRPAQQIGLTKRVAGQHLGNLHHLLLIDDDAIRLHQDRL